MNLFLQNIIIDKKLHDIKQTIMYKPSRIYINLYGNKKIMKQEQWARKHTEILLKLSKGLLLNGTAKVQGDYNETVRKNRGNDVKQEFLKDINIENDWLISDDNVLVST